MPWGLVPVHHGIETSSERTDPIENITFPDPLNVDSDERRPINFDHWTVYCRSCN